MEQLRFVCYLIGLLMAFVMASQLLRIRHDLAKLLAGMMFAWVLNCLTLAVMLYLKLGGIDWSAVASEPVWTVNAVILALTPLVLYVWFLRQNGTLKGNG